MNETIYKIQRIKWNLIVKKFDIHNIIQNETW